MSEFAFISPLSYAIRPLLRRPKMLRGPSCKGQFCGGDLCIRDIIAGDEEAVMRICRGVMGEG